jgi:glutamate-1-semialdehyde 2,1-aminomutase
VRTELEQDMPNDGRISGVERARIAACYERECMDYATARPKSRALIEKGVGGYHAGVPLHWMLDWPMPFPMVVASAQGATLTDVDGIDLADFCLGDTGAMFGHSPAPVAHAIAQQATRGLSYMLPTEDALAVAPLLEQRFGLPHWQIATTASDANRFALRVARAVTRRPRIVVMNGCYHGAVDETYVNLINGRGVNKQSLIGQYVDLSAETRVVEFNDVAALAVALEPRDVACVITEPVLTNCAMVLPDPGYHAELRRLTRATGTLLLIDETHTISTGPRGYSGAHRLEPDIFVLGKPVAGGVPASVWGFTSAISQGWAALSREKLPGHSGLGTTLSANALALTCMRATLTRVMTDAAYAHMETLAKRLAEGLELAVSTRGLPWHIARVGARVEFICARGPLRCGAEGLAAHQPELERAVHVGLVNRGCLIAPFHNMMLVCPATTAAQVDRLVDGFDDVLGTLAS